METKQDLNEIRKKLTEHIKTNFPLEQAEEFIFNINQMNDAEFIDFLKEQGIMKDEKTSEQNCIFCSMALGKIPVTKLDEIDEALAILELNPVSKGHTLIIPKKHFNSKEKISDSIKKFSEKIEKTILEKLKPKKVEAVISEIMDHTIINLIPVYQDENINSKREKRTPEELKKIKEELEKKTEIPKEEVKPEPPKQTKKEITPKNTWLPKKFI